jgi:hypothetical protein
MILEDKTVLDRTGSSEGVDTVSFCSLSCSRCRGRVSYNSEGVSPSALARPLWNGLDVKRSLKSAGVQEQGHANDGLLRRKRVEKTGLLCFQDCHDNSRGKASRIHVIHGRKKRLRCTHQATLFFSPVSSFSSRRCTYRCSTSVFRFG